MEQFREDPEIEKILKLILPSLNQGLKTALEEFMNLAKYVVDYGSLSRLLIDSIERHYRLPELAKAKMEKELEEIYRKAQSEVPVNALRSGFVDFIMPDERALSYASKLTDFYLGKFFQGDRQIRKRVVDWLSQYYLEHGNPIGRGQTGIKEFLKSFRQYIKPQTEWKARQIIDTSVNYLRNSARLHGFVKARIEYYRWDATNDRLTCPICRSLDGRVFKTETSYRVLQTIESSEDPSIITQLKPILREPFKGPTEQVPNRFPPAHPHCRCRIVAHTEDDELPMPAVQPVGPDTPERRALEEELRALKPEELKNRIKAHLGSEWARPPAKPEEKHIADYLGKFVQRHFEKHRDELGVNSLEEYNKLAYDIIKKPDAVYVERVGNLTYYVFYRGNMKVACSDDNMAITTLHKQEVEKWIKDRVERLKASIVRIL